MTNMPPAVGPDGDPEQKLWQRMLEVLTSHMTPEQIEAARPDMQKLYRDLAEQEAAEALKPKIIELIIHVKVAHDVPAMDVVRKITPLLKPVDAEVVGIEDLSFRDES